MPLYIKDDATARLVDQLARERRTTKQHAVKLAVEAELNRLARLVPLRARIAAWRDEHPVPQTSGKFAKAFLKDLWDFSE